MRILARERELPGATAGQFQTLLKAEARRVPGLQRSGALHETWFRAPEHTPVLLLECADRDEALRLLSGPPLVQAGLVEFEIVPLGPYDGSARLFRERE